MAYFTTKKKNTSAVPTGHTVDNIQVNSELQQQIKDQMAANSQSWHSAATQQEKDALHAKNEALAQLLGSGVSYDSSTGKWSGTADTGSSSKNASTSFSYQSAPSSFSYTKSAPAAFSYTKSEPAAFSYQSAPEYVNRYQDQIDSLTQQILNREAFSYDAEQDPLYQQYKKDYTRGGQRAMQDTLGKVAASTGGLASSYATSAAQQAYGNYMSALASKIPELQQLAYSMYVDEGNTQRNNLSMLQGLESSDYGKYQDSLSQYNADKNFAYGQYQDELSKYYTDKNFAYQQYLNELSQYNTDRDFAYGQYLDELNQYNTDRNFAYGQYRDSVADDWKQKEFDYSAARDALSDSRYEQSYTDSRQDYADSRSDLDYQRAQKKAETLAAAGDFSGYQALGYSDAEIANMKVYYDAAQLLKAKSAGSSYSGKSGASDKKEQDGDSSGSYSDSYFQKAMQTLNLLMAGEKYDLAVSSIDSFWGKLSSKQKQSVQALLQKYGKSYTQ